MTARWHLIRGFALMAVAVVMVLTSDDTFVNLMAIWVYSCGMVDHWRWLRMTRG